MTVASNATFTLILTEDGNICAFGDNSYGCLGLGHNTRTVGPVMLNHEELFGGHTAVMVAVGGSFASCVTIDGSFWNWGNNRRHMLGVGHTAPTQGQTPYRRPRKLCQSMHGNSPVAMVALGNTSTNILTANGDIWTFLIREPVPRMMNRAHFDGAAIGMIASGHEHVLALSKTGGHLWSWGGNDSSQTGLDTDMAVVQEPTAIPATFDGGEVRFICCGYDFTMAVTKDGVLWACGSNMSGECGAIDWTVSSVFQRVGGAEYFGPGGVHAVSCGNAHTLILAKNHSVWSCGWNAYAELGTPLPLGRTSCLGRPRLVHIEFPYDPEVPDDNDVVLVAAGTYVSFVVTSGGLVFLFGISQLWEVHQEFPHQLPDWVLGNAGITSDNCRAGRWHVSNRKRTIAFVQGVGKSTAPSNTDTTASVPVPSGMKRLPKEILQYLFENMRLVPPETMGVHLPGLMGPQEP